MRDSSHKLIYLLWTVIAVLIIGAGIGAFLLLRHASDLDNTNAELSGSNDSLRRQLEQAKASPTPTATPEATATPSPSPSPTATPVPTATPKPTASPKAQ
ncbi:MAG TPA: hypothetical protein VMT30_04715 [Candidatus Saccharimonadia bacterium]|nr:hypothetical protein [Candidatus Saccharimonadia bacterium]